jgi:hypothetical protein
MSSIAAKKSCRRKVNIVRASLQATPHRNVGKDQAIGQGSNGSSLEHVGQGCVDGIVNLLTDERLNARYIRIAKLSGKAIQHRRARHAFPRFEGLGA